MASKGFKYAKGKKLEDPGKHTDCSMLLCIRYHFECLLIFSEELSYDDVEEPRKDSGAKRKGSQNDTSISSKKSRTSGASARSNASAGSHSKSSHSKSKTQTAQKHHYPTSSYELSAELLDSGKRHQGVLSDLVDEIATAERRTLQAYARSEQSRTLKGKKHIFESMDAVLKDMATEVHKLCPPEVVFEPEVPRAERSQLKPLQDTKRLLEQHSHKLELFENNIAHLAKEYDLWLGSDAVAERLEHAAQVGASVLMQTCFLKIVAHM